MWFSGGKKYELTKTTDYIHPWASKDFSIQSDEVIYYEVKFKTSGTGTFSYGVEIEQTRQKISKCVVIKKVSSLTLHDNLFNYNNYILTQGTQTVTFRPSDISKSYYVLIFFKESVKIEKSAYTNYIFFEPDKTWDLKTTTLTLNTSSWSQKYQQGYAYRYDFSPEYNGTLTFKNKTNDTNIYISENRGFNGGVNCGYPSSSYSVNSGIGSISMKCDKGKNYFLFTRKKKWDDYGTGDLEVMYNPKCSFVNKGTLLGAEQETETKTFFSSPYTIYYYSWTASSSGYVRWYSSNQSMSNQLLGWITTNSTPSSTYDIWNEKLLNYLSQSQGGAWWESYETNFSNSISVTKGTTYYFYVKRIDSTDYGQETVNFEFSTVPWIKLCAYSINKKSNTIEKIFTISGNYYGTQFNTRDLFNKENIKAQKELKGFHPYAVTTTSPTKKIPSSSNLNTSITLSSFTPIVLWHTEDTTKINNGKKFNKVSSYIYYKEEYKIAVPYIYINNKWIPIEK